jgi:hypothetical protein
MLIGSPHHLIRWRFGKLDELDMLMWGGNRMHIRINGGYKNFFPSKCCAGF